jgi:hypothetical protein
MNQYKIGKVFILASMLSCCLSRRLLQEAASKSVPGESFCSPEGLMTLIPSLRNVDGLFQIPDPSTDLQGFYRVHQSLTNAISVALIQSQVQVDPRQAALNTYEPLTFGPDWRSAEVGVNTSGRDTDFSSAYGGQSFLSGIVPVSDSGGIFYQVVNETKGTVSSLVSPQPTTLPCVNRILLAEETSGGTWMPPSFALGPEGGEAYLIVDLCVDLANPGKAGGVSVLTPSASLFVAIQWADIPAFAHMKTDQQSVMHRGSEVSSAHMNTGFIGALCVVIYYIFM